MRLLPCLLLALAASLAGEEPNDYPATVGAPPMIGMFPGGVPDEVARKQGIPPGTGVLVLGVIPGSMADRMGLKAGDVVTTLNGTPVNSYDEIVAARDQRRAGDPAEMGFVHQGERRAASGTLGAWPHDDTAADGDGGARNLLHRAAEAAQRRHDADLQRGVDELRDELAALRERLDREDAAAERDPPAGPWRLEWRSRPVPPEGTPTDSIEPAIGASAPVDDERAWRLRWSNARPAVKDE